MRTIIVGCGRVGATLASRLASEGDLVTIIDTRTEAFDRLDDAFTGEAVRDNVNPTIVPRETPREASRRERRDKSA